MKQYFVFFLFLISIISCSDDDGAILQENSFSLSGIEYKTPKGYLFDLEDTSFEGAHAFLLAFVSEDINLNFQGDVMGEGSGNASVFFLYSLDNLNITEGTYSSSITSGTSYNVAEANLGLNLDFENGLDDATFGGGATVRIESSGNVYTVEYNFVLDDGREVRGSFKGDLIN